MNGRDLLQTVRVERSISQRSIVGQQVHRAIGAGHHRLCRPQQQHLNGCIGILKLQDTYRSVLTELWLLCRRTWGAWSCPSQITWATPRAR